MKIGVIQASTQKSKNKIIEDCLCQAISQDYDQIINFGVYDNANENMSYIQIALCISLLLESNSIDFIITGCSSGQGMMLACNSLPGVICGYVENITDAYLFGRINNGNAISYPLGFNWGWGAELNLKETLRVLFDEPFGIGYPKEHADRKIKDTEQLKKINKICKKDLAEVLPMLDKDIVESVLNYNTVYDYIMEYGTNEELKNVMRKLR
ncbi:RpiB/LacA/LacB family sugar-phosphate isomerase [Kineothrix sp. MB12-C1]|uniref:RpiB/LacA/LacB family sugar-phosphate isomerase n=1 Tax=Kineothrix sp. MB12-C1 TaxID=3070215 RepID=UPI0027D21763|nr:RpiB/LacA/LacB family sugar-phosphate isomerase [Kineothrix sp. MB12-C1]WMC92586.1 RpiB/LacA/LacB family sugar-phosphate isomerase [Kineothrix sp. MB12-C1]